MANKIEILAAVVKENKGDFVLEPLLLDPPRPNEVRLHAIYGPRSSRLITTDIG